MSNRFTNIALIGLGNMGHPIGMQWVRAGQTTVTGFDLSSAARDAFARDGGRTADDMADAVVGAEAIVLLLPNSQVVDSVFNALLASQKLAPGVIIIDMSSSEPEHTRANARIASEHNISFIDAPISGGVLGAENGTLTVMLGAEDSDAAAVTPLLSEVGSVIHVGSVGTGHAAKALNNLLSATHFWATSEAIIVGERFGIDPQVLLDVINSSSGRSGSSEAKWPNFVLPRTFNSGFAATLMLKDAKIAATLMRSSGAPSALAEQLVNDWESAVADLPSSADHTEIARWISERI